MPPFIPHKRHGLAQSPPDDTPAKRPKLDHAARSDTKSLPERQRLKQPVYTLSDSSDSSLSSIDSDAFENIALAKNSKPSPAKKAIQIDDDSDNSDEVEWENAINHQQETYVPKHPAKVSGDVQFSLEADDDFAGFEATGLQRKQGISKAEKATRIAAHQLHVQFLLWHNAVRNRWISDKIVQKALIDQLPDQIQAEVGKWRRASGLVDEATLKTNPSGKKRKAKKQASVNIREERDWGRPSQRLEEGKADMSSGEPLISLLKILSAYWKKRFAITAPGLRKRGYSTRLERRKEVNSYKNDPHDPEKHGERIRDLKEFREVARKCEGSRDVGAQLFTALLRGLGIESRLVASLQPAGFGATKAEEMTPKKVLGDLSSKPPPSSSSESDQDVADIETISTPNNKHQTRKAKTQPSRKISVKRMKDEYPNSDRNALSESEDDSVVDITPALPKKRSAMYDREVPYPIYWTEAVSPITNKVYPVSPLVLDKPVATNDEMLGNFEPRGAKADKVKLVIAYVIGYSSDGSAKDVTVRYLRKHIWPGKTKPFRFPVEKIPVYDRTGRIKRYENYDWFKHVMSAYARPEKMRTAVDDVEESTDLIRQQPEKKLVDDTVDTLSSLKASEDFVLERFLRREEAIRPGAKPDRTFLSGKGESSKEEPVYRRSDVERCLTTESWHKEGRIPKLGEVPLKHVPVRAVTLTRKREAEEHERLTGEKQLQGLYSWDQTEYIIPPPIQNGIIPKNSFGNIDAFVPSMVPKGAAHVPLKGTVRICKKLEIDYAEAVVGFEFGNKRAVPVIRGVVIAKENEKAVREEWKKWNQEQKRKEEMKLEKLVLEMWRKFIIGLKIRKRVQAQYGEDVEMGGGGVETLPDKLMSGLTQADAIEIDEYHEGEPSGLGTEAASEATGLDDTAPGGGFFLPHSDEEMSEAEELIMEDHNDQNPDAATARRKRIMQTSEDEQQPPALPSKRRAKPKHISQEKGTLLQRQANVEDSEEDSSSSLSPPPIEIGQLESPQGRAWESASESGDSDTESHGSPSLSPSTDNSDSEDYNPMSKRASRATTTRRSEIPATTPARRTSGRLTKSEVKTAQTPAVNGSKSQVEVAMSSHKGGAKSTPTKTAVKRAVVSPYFDDPSAKGTARKRNKRST